MKQSHLRIYFLLALLFSNTSFAKGEKIMSYGKAIPYSKGESLKFPDFSLTYVDYVHYQHPIASISTNTQVFMAKSEDNKELKIEVVSGQLPPRPEEFSINDKVFILYTFSGPKGLRLEPGHLLVEKTNKVKPEEELEILEEVRISPENKKKI